VTSEEGQALADELGMPFIETSAKSADNVKEAFVEMAKSLIDIKERDADAAASATKGGDGAAGGVTLEGGSAGGKGKCC